MDNPCDSVTCPNGNCVGCLNGQVNCFDSRCHPYCPTCAMPKEFETVSLFAISMIVIFLFILILIVLAGFWLYRDDVSISI